MGLGSAIAWQWSTCASVSVCKSEKEIQVNEAEGGMLQICMTETQ